MDTPANGQRERRPARHGHVGANLVGAAVVAAAAGLLLSRRPVTRPAPALPEVVRTDLFQRDGRWYAKGHTQPFVGWLVDLGPDGARLARSAISNGVLNGLSEGWHTNGQMRIQEYFHENVSDGLRRKWFPNGRLASEATIVHGDIEGVFQRWYPSGQLAERIEMKAGRPEGLAWAFYESGFLKASTRAEAGRVVNQARWKDGEKPAPH